MTNDDKVCENRLRRILHRRGYRLMKSRRRDQYALDYGHCQIVNTQTDDVVADHLTVADVEAWIDASTLAAKRGRKRHPRSNHG
jgi:hypothetical protein